jgi:hypothetical protein
MQAGSLRAHTSSKNVQPISGIQAYIAYTLSKSIFELRFCLVERTILYTMGALPIITCEGNATIVVGLEFGCLQLLIRITIPVEETR